MSRRVVLGKLGTDSGTAKYGFRVSKTGSDVVPSSSSSATVATSDLIFDSLNGVGSLDVYKVFLVEDVPAYSPPTTVTINTIPGAGGTPGSKVQSFGETLSGIPYTIAQRVVSGTEQESYRFTETEAILNTTSGAPPALVGAYGPADEGWYTITTTSQITVYSYETSTIDVRIVLFNFFV